MFKRLLNKEFGRNKYEKYFVSYQRLLIENKLDNSNLEHQEIFKDIYQELKDDDTIDLENKLERLLETMMLAFRISKQYIFAIAAYICGFGFLIFQNLQVAVTVGSLVIISFCFLYKTYEFVINRYCYIDAYIIIVYKAVLDKILVTRQGEQG